MDHLKLKRQSISSKIGVLIGIPVFGLDAISSAIYTPEALIGSLTSQTRSYLPLIIAGILVLYTIVMISYWNVIELFPAGGGSYSVAKINSGDFCGLIAAAGLSIDYCLNPAIAIVAGVNALVSAYPLLYEYRLLMCIIILLLLTALNFFGIRNPGLFLVIPAYLFIVCLSITIIAASIAVFTNSLDMQMPETFFKINIPVETDHLLVLFVLGCSALTGIEAVSNGVLCFKKPAIDTAKKCHLAISIISMLFVCTILTLAVPLSLGMQKPESQYESIIAQFYSSVFEKGLVYHLMIFLTLLIVVFSANTSFASFPQVCRTLADDKYLWPIFKNNNSHNVNYGTLFTVTAISIIFIIFSGISIVRLIPLFTSGVFIAFTMTLAGLVIYFWRHCTKINILFLAADIIGTILSFTVFSVLFINYFFQSTWVIIVCICVVCVLWMNRRMS